MFTKLFRTNNALVARLIFMTGPEEAPEKKSTGEDTETNPAQVELTAIIEREVANILTDTKKTVDTKGAETLGKELIEDQKLDEREKQAIIDLLRLQVNERLDARAKAAERVRIGSSVTPWEKMDTTENQWRNLAERTTVTITGLTPDELAHTGLYELLPPEVIAVEKDGVTYYRSDASTKGRLGYYSEAGKYLAIKENETKITIKQVEKRATIEEVVGPEDEEDVDTLDTEGEPTDPERAIDSSNIYERSMPIPDWLEGTKKQWDEKLRHAEQTNEGKQRRVVEIIQAEPFNWTTTEFYDVVFRGGTDEDNTNYLTFNDILKAKLGINGKQAEKIKKDTFNLEQGKYTVAESAFAKTFNRKVEKQEKIKTEKIQPLLETLNEPEKQAWERKSNETFDAWHKRIAENADDTVYTKEKKQLLRYIKSLTKAEEFKTMCKGKIDQTQSTIGVLEQSAAELMDAIAGISQGKVETYETGAAPLGTQGEQVAEEIFTDAEADERAQKHEMIDVERGKGMGKRRTDTLSAHEGGSSAYRELFAAYEGLMSYDPDTGKMIVDEEKTMEALKTLLEKGIDEMPRDATVSIVEIAESLGIPIPNKEALKALEKKRKTLRRDIDNLKIKIKKLKRKVSKGKDKKGELATKENELQTKEAELRDTIEKLTTGTVEIREELKTKLITDDVIKGVTNTTETAEDEAVRTLVRLGFANDSEHRERAKHVLACQDVINDATTDETVKRTLNQIILQDVDQNIPPEKYRELAQKVEAQVKILKKGIQIPQTSVEAQRLLTVGAGVGTQGGIVGAGVGTQGGIGGGLDFPVGDGASVHIAGGFNNGQFGVGGGFTKAWELSDNVSASLTVDVSTLGITGMAAVTVDLGKSWQLTAAAGGGLLWNFVPYAAQSVIIGVDAEGLVDTSVRRAEIGSGLGESIDLFEKGNTDAALTKFKELPQVKEFAKKLKTEHQGNQTLIDALLIEEFSFMREQVRTQGTQDAVLWPAISIGGTLVEIAGIVVPVGFIKFTIPLGTKVIPVLEHTEGETQAYSDAEIQRQLKEQFNENIGTPLHGHLETEDVKIVIDGTGERKVAFPAGKKEEFVGSVTKESIDAYNTGAHRIGIHLEATEKEEDNLYKMGFSNVDDAFVQVHIDPQAKGKMSLAYDVNTENKTNDIYLSFNTARQNVIITREEFILPYTRDGKNRIVVFTIKENPNRTRAEIERTESGYLEYSRDLQIDTRGRNKGERRFVNTYAREVHKGTAAGQNNIFALQSSAYEGEETYVQHAESARGTIEFAQQQFEEIYTKEDGIFDTFTVEHNDTAVDDAALAKTVDAYLLAHPEDARMVSTKGYEFKGNGVDNRDEAEENYGELLQKIFPDRTLSPEETEVVLNHLIVQSFQQIYGNAEQFQRDLDRFFRPMLEEIFTKQTGNESTGKMLAREYLEALRVQRLQFNVGDTIPENMEVYALVGTKGITGLRGMSNFSGKEKYEVLQMVSLNNASPALRKAVLDIISPIDGSDAELLDSRLGVEIALWAPLIFGIEKTQKLLDAKKSGNFTNANNVMKDVRRLAKKIRAAEVRGDNAITFNGTTIDINVDLKAGIYERCGNPLFMGEETITVHGVPITAEQRNAMKTDANARREFINIVIGFAVQKPKEPPEPPGKGPPPPAPDTDDGLAADEIPDAGVVVKPSEIVLPANWGGNTEAPGQ